MMTQDECTNLEQLLAILIKYHPEANVDLVSKAYHFAEKAHEGQKRKSGEPYFIHPLTVSSILAKLMLDAPTIAAGLLHDTVEDCEGCTQEVIEQEFGTEVAQLVDGLTKLAMLEHKSGSSKQAENFRKLLLAMSEDIRVLLIKLADRLANITYSCSMSNRINNHMKEVYKNELPHFLESINPHSDDPRKLLPQVMIDEINRRL